MINKETDSYQLPFLQQTSREDEKADDVIRPAVLNFGPPPVVRHGCRRPTDGCVFYVSSSQARVTLEAFPIVSPYGTAVRSSHEVEH